MKILALDLSTKTGYCVMEGERGTLPSIISYGQIRVPVEDFCVNAKPGPHFSPLYPWNVFASANEMGSQIKALIDDTKPDLIVIENTTKGANRHTQRILEWIHKNVLFHIQIANIPMRYIDPSEWRKVLEIRLSNQDKKNNRLVAKGEKRGRITRKHLAVRWVNKTFDKNFKIKDNDICDSIALGSAYYMKVAENA